MNFFRKKHYKKFYYNLMDQKNKFIGIRYQSMNLNKQGCNLHHR